MSIDFISKIQLGYDFKNIFSLYFLKIIFFFKSGLVKVRLSLPQQFFCCFCCLRFKTNTTTIFTQKRLYHILSFNYCPFSFNIKQQKQQK